MYYFSSSFHMLYFWVLPGVRWNFCDFYPRRGVDCSNGRRWSSSTSRRKVPLKPRASLAPGVGPPTPHRRCARSVFSFFGCFSARLRDEGGSSYWTSRLLGSVVRLVFVVLVLLAFSGAVQLLRNSLPELRFGLWSLGFGPL